MNNIQRYIDSTIVEKKHLCQTTKVVRPMVEKCHSLFEVELDIFVYNCNSWVIFLETFPGDLVLTRV